MPQLNNFLNDHYYVNLFSLQWQFSSLQQPY